MLLLAAAPAGDIVIVRPKELVSLLRGPDLKPVVIGVGPAGMYRRKHITGSIGTGAADRPEGLEALKAAAAKIPKYREIVVYCGCCPWDSCPNIRPAVELLKKLGYGKVKALMLYTSFGSDWVDQGYPVEGTTAR